MPTTTEPTMGLALTTDDTPYDFQSQVNTNWTRLKDHTHAAGYGQPIARATTLQVTGGETLSTGDLLVVAGRYQSVSTAHNFGWDTPTARWTMTDSLYVAGQVIAAGGLVSTGGPVSVTSATPDAWALVVQGAPSLGHSLGLQVSAGSNANDEALQVRRSGASGDSTILLRLMGSGNLGLGPTAPACKLDVPGAIRSTAFVAPPAGVGLELYYDGTQSMVQSFNRDLAQYRPLVMSGTTIRHLASGADSGTFGPSGNSGNAFLMFPARVGNTIFCYDNGSGSGFGLGINSAEMVIFAPTNSVIGFRTQNYAGSRGVSLNPNDGTITGTTLNVSAVSNASLNACSLNATCTASDGFTHNGWVRINGAYGLLALSYGIGITITDAIAPRFYSGTFANEYLQSRGRDDGLHRVMTSGNATLDPNQYDGGVFNSGTYVYLPDMNQCTGRAFNIKNITGANFSVYVTNGQGIYDNAWRNPFVLANGDAITVYAAGAYGGWMIW